MVQTPMIFLMNLVPIYFGNNTSVPCSTETSPKSKEWLALGLVEKNRKRRGSLRKNIQDAYTFFTEIIYIQGDAVFPSNTDYNAAMKRPVK